MLLFPVQLIVGDSRTRCDLFLTQNLISLPIRYFYQSHVIKMLQDVLNERSNERTNERTKMTNE